MKITDLAANIIELEEKVEENRTNPKISIIVPVYKVEKYLDRCVQSILNQTFTDFELILVDDGSPDQCPQMCDKWAKKDKRIIIIHKGNGGPSSARNAGIKISKGKYLSFVDSDDWIDPNLYRYLYDLIITTSSDMSECDWHEMSEYGYKSFSYIKEKITLLNQKQAYWRFFRIIDTRVTYWPWGKLFSRECVQNVLFPSGKFFEDIDFNFHVLLNVKKVAISNLPLYYYFQSTGSTTRHTLCKRDLDIFEIWDGIVREAARKIPDMYEYAVYNRQRADFGLLCKGLKYGCSEDSEWYKEIQRQLVIQLKEHYFYLIKGKMPVNRKILLTLICLNYRTISEVFKIFRFISKTP